MNHKSKGPDLDYPILSRPDYKSALKEVQIELVKLQRKLIARQERVLVIIEGRDAAGKDGLIKRLTQHMAPRETRVFAVAKPSDRENTEWYFQRFNSELPAGGEFVVFNRSWYNRAGVEHVMGFCNDREYEQFMTAVVDFEALLVHDGIILLKYYLDISKSVQKERLAERENDPLTQWKVSPIDQAAQKHWDDYSLARDEMFRRTSHEAAPWIVVRADDKRTARVAMIRDLLSRLQYENKDENCCRPDRRIVFLYSKEAAQEGFIAP
ncbi:MAG TPA: polyphosphate kinase 2 [Alphaproteobacteria bacterium]|nr:polyphosphate kinase 2 [Alphaproteobacteria bacterium]